MFGTIQWIGYPNLFNQARFRRHRRTLMAPPPYKSSWRVTSQTVKRKDVLNGMIKLQDHIKSYNDPQVGSIIGSISVADIVRETNRVMTTNTEADYKIPDTDRGVSDMLFLFENSGREQLERLVTTNYTPPT